MSSNQRCTRNPFHHNKAVNFPSFDDAFTSNHRSNVSSCPKSPAPRSQNKNVFMLSDLISPGHPRQQLNSPFSSDKNARIFTQNPCDITVFTPQKTTGSNRVLSEMRCNGFFRNRLPILTPSPKRMNPQKLYDPKTDMNITMKLEQSTPVFSENRNPTDGSCTSNRNNVQNGSLHQKSMDVSDFEMAFPQFPVSPISNKRPSSDFGFSFDVGSQKRNQANNALSSAQRGTLFADAHHENVYKHKDILEPLDLSAILDTTAVNDPDIFENLATMSSSNTTSNNSFCGFFGKYESDDDAMSSISDG